MIFGATEHFQEKILKAIFILLFLISGTSGNAAEKFFGKRSFTNYTVQNGLPSNTVYSIIQDSLGFIWLGTQQGICRFDGLEFKTYQTDPENKNSLGFNNAGNLFYDSHGKIWIGTWGEGADCFDPATETFTHYKNDPENSRSLAGERIQTIFEDRFGTLWFCSESRGVSRLDEKDRERGYFTNYIFDDADSNSIASPRVRDVAEDKEGNLWFASDNGFFRLKKENREKGLFDRFNLPRTNENFYSNVVYTIFVSSEGKLYLGTDFGIFIIDKPEKLGTRLKKSDYRHVNFIKNDNLLGYNTIFVIREDYRGRIWLGTNGGGLILLGYGKKGFIRFTRKIGKANRLPDNFIRSIFEDRTHNLWVGTLNKGVAKLDLKNYGFHSAYFSFLDKSFIVEGQNGNIYIGVSVGVQQLSVDENGNYSKTRLEFPRAYKTLNYLYGIYDNGNLYLYSVLKGFIKYDLSSGKTEPLPGLNKIIRKEKSSLIHAIKSKYEDRVIWMAFEDGEFLRYDLKTRKTYGYLVISSKDYGKITTFYENEDGDLWIGTAEGLGFWKRDAKVLQFELPMEIELIKHSEEKNSLINNYILSIAEDNTGNLWIGTLNGLSSLSIKNNEYKFRNYTSGNGLANNRVVSIVPGKKRVWIGTDYGLSSIWYRSHRFTNYYDFSGLPGNKFSFNASIKAKDGRIFMATTSGVAYFYPDSVKRNRCKPKVAISDIFFLRENVDLPVSISYAHELNLEHDANTFIIKLASLEFTYPQSNKFYYKLEGYDKRWNHPRYKNQVVFVDLPPGEYLLKFSGSNNNNIWGKYVFPLKIIVNPAFWQTIWFQMAILLLILSAFGFWSKNKLNQIKKLSEEITKRQEAQKRLEESEKKYREFIEKAIDAIIIIDKDGKILDLNPGFVNLTGFSYEESKEKSFFSLFFDKDEGEVREKFDVCINNGSVQFEARVKTKNEKIKWVSVLLNPIYDERQQLKYIHVIARNITELKAAEKNLLNAKKRAERAEKLRTNFLAQMSHEIRTPVYTILNSINVFRYREMYDDDEMNRSLKALEKASERIFRTIDLVLRMADLQTGSFTPNLAEHDIVETVRLVYSKYIAKAKSKELEFSLETFSERIPLVYDTDSMETVIDNIVNNAIVFTEKGNVSIKILQKQNGIAVEISDTGKGITDEELKIIFNPFIQAEQGYKRKYDGTGLGLTIARAYCKHNNCKMFIGKNNPQGTVVTLLFLNVNSKSV